VSITEKNWFLPRHPQAWVTTLSLITNAVFYHRIGTALVAPDASHHNPALIVLTPVVGGLIIGLLARFGSEKIRGHGMPSAWRTPRGATTGAVHVRRPPVAPRDRA
jgi:H+/Cl- antiporter ClcA